MEPVYATIGIVVILPTSLVGAITLLTFARLGYKLIRQELDKSSLLTSLLKENRSENPSL